MNCFDWGIPEVPVPSNALQLEYSIYESNILKPIMKKSLHNSYMLEKQPDNFRKVEKKVVLNAWDIRERNHKIKSPPEKYLADAFQFEHNIYEQYFPHNSH